MSVGLNGGAGLEVGEQVMPVVNEPTTTPAEKKTKRREKETTKPKEPGKQNDTNRTETEHAGTDKTVTGRNRNIKT